jgi:hypothetical protein
VTWLGTRAATDWLPAFTWLFNLTGRCQLLGAATHAHAVHHDPVASGNRSTHDRRAARPDATRSSDAPGADDGIRVSCFNSHDSHERSDGESSEYEQAHNLVSLV